MTPGGREGLLTPAEDLARALARFLASPHAADPWAKYPTVLGVEEVAEIMGSNADAVREACRRKRLPLKKKHGRYVVAQDVFRAWLADEESR